MTEEATRVKDATSGDYIATRTAQETDDDSNPRMIQLVDFASRVQDYTSYNRGVSAWISGADSTNLDSMVAEAINNAVDIGDASVLWVLVHHKATDGSVKITPVLLDGSDDPIGVLSTKETAIGSKVFRIDSGTPYYTSPILVWDSLGALKLAIHITEIGGTSNEIKIYAGAV